MRKDCANSFDILSYIGKTNLGQFRPVSRGSSMRAAVLLFASLIFLCPAARAEQPYSANIAGAPGLLTVPSARMFAPGTVSVHTGALDPYFHGVLGLQIAKPLYIALRQTAQTSSLTGQAERLYPGIDLRLRLAEESAWTPDVTIGLQSAFGHRRMGAEYLALSKRFGDFDLTGGMGWGRMGGGSFGNPMKIFGDHFGKNRNPDDEMPGDAGDWFTGSDSGLFGGVEYFPPGQNFSLKAEWRSDDFGAERAGSDYKAPARWGIGAAFHPADWIDFNVGIAGFDKILGSLTFRPQMKTWPWRTAKREAEAPMSSYRAGISMPEQMETDAGREIIALYAAQAEGGKAGAMLELPPDGDSLPFHAGRAARRMAGRGGESVEELTVTPTFMGLRGPALSMMRRDLEQALARHQGSPQEIWRNARFDKSAPDRIAAGPPLAPPSWPRLILDNQVSLSEEDSGILYRTSLVLEEARNLGRHFMAGGALRLNLKDNLEGVETLRPAATLPVRSDVNRFTAQVVHMDRSYLGWLSTPKTDLHVALAGGYLEEMYAGAGGEVLYRPFGKTFALGADAWLAFRRDPYTPGNMGLNGDHLLTGHINAWYEIPDTDLTLHARIGRYLAEDLGGTLALEKRLDNGVRLSAFATATNDADFDPFGGTTHLYSGLKISVPLGGIPRIPNGSEARLSAAPFGRDAGQALDRPLDLYNMTERFSLRHIAAHWNDIVE